LQSSPSLKLSFRFDIAVDSEYFKVCYLESYSLENIYNRNIDWTVDRFKHSETVKKLRSHFKKTFRIVYTEIYEKNRAKYLDSLLYNNFDFSRNKQRIFRQKFWQLLANVEETVELKNENTVSKFIVERVWSNYVYLAIIVELRTQDKIRRFDFSQKRENKIKNYYFSDDYKRDSEVSWLIFQ